MNEHDEIADFWEPVQWQELGLFDYPEIVKNPMDLTTIKVRSFVPSLHLQNKFDNKQYTDVFDFAYDMRLMWRNCLTYNQVRFCCVAYVQDGCYVTDTAKRYQKIFEDRLSRILSQCTCFVWC